MTKPNDDFDIDSLDAIEVDEAKIAEKQAGGGEAIADGEADCEGCKI